MFFNRPKTPMTVEQLEQWLESAWDILVNHEHRICKLEGDEST